MPCERARNAQKGRATDYMIRVHTTVRGIIYILFYIHTLYLVLTHIVCIYHMSYTTLSRNIRTIYILIFNLNGPYVSGQSGTRYGISVAVAGVP